MKHNYIFMVREVKNNQVVSNLQHIVSHNT